MRFYWVRNALVGRRAGLSTYKMNATLLKRYLFFIRFKRRRRKSEIPTHRFTWVSKSAALGWCVPSSCPDINPNISSVIKLIWVVMCVSCSLSLFLSLNIYRSCSNNTFSVSSSGACVYIWFLFLFCLVFIYFPSFFSVSLSRGFAGLMDVLCLRVFCWCSTDCLYVTVYAVYFIALWSKYPSVEIWLWTQSFGMYLVYMCVITYYMPKNKPAAEQNK